MHHELTKDLDFLSSFVKYGVNSKVACQLVKLGIPRTDASKVSKIYKEKLLRMDSNGDELPTPESNFDETIKALNIVRDHESRSEKVSKQAIQRIAKIRQKYKKEIVDNEPEFPPLELSYNDI